MRNWKLAAVVGAMTLGGVALGAWLFGGRTAQAQTAPTPPPIYRQCILAQQETTDVNGEGNVANVELSHTVLVPRGWEVVGGGGAGPVGSVILCHR